MESIWPTDCFAAAAVAVSVVVARPASAPAAGPAVIPVPTLAWASCPTAAAGAASTAGFTCATAEVPLDHADPTRGTVALAVIKAPARDPARRIGTLFWNPGGPGDSGTAYLPAALAGFPPAVRDRFDIISWDPRGMGGRTTPVVQCFAGAAEEESFLGRMMQGGFPVTRDQLARDAADRTALNAACVGRNGDLLSHVSTADNARDLDLLRRAVGEETLSYYGTSYGTVLGATYLNMFPDRVRSAVLDGAAAAPEWFGADGSGADQSTFIRLGSDFAAATTIDAFMTACGSVAAAGCAFSAGSPEATRQKWTELLRRPSTGSRSTAIPSTGQAFCPMSAARSTWSIPFPVSDDFPAGSPSRCSSSSSGRSPKAPRESRLSSRSAVPVRHGPRRTGPLDPTSQASVGSWR